MILVTKEVAKKLPAMRSQEKTKDPLIKVKFFCPWNQWTWYPYEYEPKDKLFFGYVKGIENEIGYFSLEELESVNGPMGLKIERDLYFQPKLLSKIKKGE